MLSISPMHDTKQKCPENDYVGTIQRHTIKCVFKFGAIYFLTVYEHYRIFSILCFASSKANKQVISKVLYVNSSRIS